MELIVKPPSELTAAPYNPRTISDTALAGLKASIDKFGLVAPVVWNKRTGHVVGGHQRIRALEMSGATEAPVVVVDLPESEEKALNVTLNNPGIQGEFTPDVLPMLDELEELDPIGFGELQLGPLRETGTANNNEPPIVKSESGWEVCVQCIDEQMQRETFEALSAEGYDCRLLTY